MATDKTITIAVIAAAAVVLQVVVAPYIAVAGIVPDVVAVAAVLIAVVRPDRIGCVVPFVLGLLFDLFTGGPVGAMAFTLTLCAFAASRLYAALNNDTAVMAILMAAASLLVIEVLYGVLIVVLGFNAGIVGALAYRALPTFLYDAILAVVLYLPFRRLLFTAAPIQTSITRLR